MWLRHWWANESESGKDFFIIIQLLAGFRLNIIVYKFGKEVKHIVVANNYNPETAKLLAHCCSLTYDQYQRGRRDSGYDGIVDLTGYPYRQTASFKAPEFLLTNHLAAPRLKQYLNETAPEKFKFTDFDLFRDFSKDLPEVFWGFALEAIDGSANCIIAIRGTQSIYEWIMDAAFIQVPAPLIWFKDGRLELAKAHFGFLLMYSFLIGQITAAANNFLDRKTCLVTGHSLGAALAILAALTLSTMTFPMGGRDGKIQMYNFAGPRVGNPTFVDAYNYFVPVSYRVVNLADLVPIVPPASIFGYKYQHIGTSEQEWSYLYQTEDIGGNHSIQGNYIPALQKPGIITNTKKNHPVSGD